MTYRRVEVLARTMFIICVALPWSAAAQQPEIATTVAFTEGPTVDREGNVYFTDIINQRIMKLGRDGGRASLVTRTDLKTGKIEILVDNYEGKLLQGPNDVTIDDKGRLYFTDLAGAAVYRIDAPHSDPGRLHYE